MPAPHIYTTTFSKEQIAVFEQRKDYLALLKEKFYIMLEDQLLIPLTVTESEKYITVESQFELTKEPDASVLHEKYMRLGYIIATDNGFRINKEMLFHVPNVYRFYNQNGQLDKLRKDSFMNGLNAFTNKIKKSDAMSKWKYAPVDNSAWLTDPSADFLLKLKEELMKLNIAEDNLKLSKVQATGLPILVYRNIDFGDYKQFHAEARGHKATPIVKLGTTD